MTRTPITAALISTFAMIASASLAQSSGFEGTWKVKSTSGQPFEITLSADGTAKATLRNDMTGTWKTEGQSAVITWKTGWTTKISKEGEHYTKTAYRKGQSSPANTSPADKVK